MDGLVAQFLQALLAAQTGFEVRLQRFAFRRSQTLGQERFQSLVSRTLVHTHALRRTGVHNPRRNKPGDRCPQTMLTNRHGHVGPP
jgi:hypothetical protein